jgi:EmrB/QacA subfamily drug resistance transporter
MTAQSKRTKWLVLATICFGLFMINMDGNVVNLAMPTIIRQFKATLNQMEWISNAYMLTFAVFLITLGRLGDEIGRKKMFLAGLVGFTVGSALCGSAQSVGQLIAFRVLQGIGGAAMMPATLSILTATFPKEERGRAMGFWGAASGLAFIMGPIIGGWLTQSGLGTVINSFLAVKDNWRYVFFVNLPFGVLAFISAVLVVRESRDEETRHRLDIVGVILASAAVFLLTWGFVEGPRYGWWTPSRDFVLAGVTLKPFGLSVVPFLLGLAAVLGAAFILYERRRREEPLVDLSLFSNRNYSVGMVTGVILNFALMGAMFLMPLFMQSVLGISPVHTGTLMLPFACALLVASPVAGILSDRIGGKYILVAGLVILALSDLLVAHFRVDTRAAELFIPFVVMGVGMGFSMTPLTNMTLYGVAPQKAGGASGVISTMRQVGAVMGVAIFSVILQGNMAGAIQVHAREIPGLPPAAQTVLVRYVQGGGLYGISDSGPNGLTAQLMAAMKPAGGDVKAPAAPAASAAATGSASAAASASASAAQMQTIGSGIERSMKQSFTDSVNDTFRIAAIIGAGAVAVSFLMAAGRRKKIEDVTETEVPEEEPEIEPASDGIAVGE